MLIDADGTNRQVIADPGDDWAPTWSPDGSSIGFVRGDGGIWVMEADGLHARRLSPEGRARPVAGLGPARAHRLRASRRSVDHGG